jgi:hypothetical protein
MRWSDGDHELDEEAGEHRNAAARGIWVGLALSVAFFWAPLGVVVGLAFA